MHKMLAIFLSVFLYSHVASADIDCTGKVSSLSLQLTNTGVVTVSLEGGPFAVYICAVDGPAYNNVSADVCKAMYSTLMAAKVSNKKVLMRFYGNYASCTSIPGWATAPVGWTQVLIE